MAGNRTALWGYETPRSNTCVCFYVGKDTGLGSSKVSSWKWMVRWQMEGATTECLAKCWVGQSPTIARPPYPLKSITQKQYLASSTARRTKEKFPCSCWSGIQCLGVPLSSCACHPVLHSRAGISTFYQWTSIHLWRAQPWTPTLSSPRLQSLRLGKSCRLWRHHHGSCWRWSGRSLQWQDI